MNGFSLQPTHWQLSSLQNGKMFGTAAHVNGWQAGGQAQGPSYTNGEIVDPYGTNEASSGDAGGTGWQPEQTGLLGKRGREAMDEGMSGGSIFGIGMENDVEQMSSVHRNLERSSLRLAKRPRSELRVPNVDQYSHAETQPTSDLTHHDRSGSFTNVVIQRTGSMTLDTDELGDMQHQHQQLQQNSKRDASCFPLGHVQPQTYSNSNDFLMTDQGHGPEREDERHAHSAFAFGRGIDSPTSATLPSTMSDVQNPVENSQILAQIPRMMSLMDSASSNGFVPIGRGGEQDGNGNRYAVFNGFGGGRDGNFHDTRSAMTDGTPSGRYGAEMNASTGTGMGMGIGFPPGAPPPSLRSISIEAEPYWIDGMHGRSARVASNGSMSPDMERTGGARVLDAVVIEDDVDMLPSSPELPAVPPGSRSNSFGAGNLIGPTDLTMSSFTKASGRTRYMQGPRADCPKCEAGVPGHYGHWA